MKTENQVITKLSTTFFAVVLAISNIATVKAEEVKTKNLIEVTILTQRVQVVEEGCTLYVNLGNIRTVSEYNVRCFDKYTGEEFVNMDLTPFDGQLEIPLVILPLGEYTVEITNRTTHLILDIEKVDETSDIFYDPFATTDDAVRR